MIERRDYWTRHGWLRDINDSHLSEIYKPEVRFINFLQDIRANLKELRGFSNERPIISVVIPALNEENYIPLTLYSLGMNYVSNPPSTEVIVVDNCSTDDTFRISRDSGAEVVTCLEKGTASALQKGLETSKGDIVVSLGADTIISPEHLSIVSRFFQKNPDVAAVYGPIIYTSEWGPSYLLDFYNFTATTIHSLKRKLRPRKITAHGANFAARREDVQNVGGYNTSVAPGVEDGDLARRMLEVGEVVFLKDQRITVFTSGRRMQKEGIFTLGAERLLDEVRDILDKTKPEDKRGPYPVIR